MPTLNWVGKDEVLNHNPAYYTLEKKYTFNSRNDTSENMIIKGDNLLALKALLPQYENKIKCIYIDPPYNTGNENWIYNDNVNNPKIKKWLGEVVAKDDLSRHDKWLCMMLPRLKLLHRLLSDDGVIFISIDDNEMANLKLLCDEVFGGGGFLANIIWEKSYSPINLKKHFSNSHDYILCYAKNILNAKCNGLQRSDEANSRYSNPDNDPRGVWKNACLYVGPRVEENVYPVTSPTGKVFYPSSGYSWLFSQERFKEMLDDNRIYFGANGNNAPSLKRFLSEVKQTVTPMTIWKYTEVGHSQDATKNLKSIFDGNAVFDYPKSVDLLKRCFELYADKNSIILDSFAGSGTTAHAVLELNKKDGGNRKFILVEMEDYAENITAERVRRVIKGYGKEPENSATGGDFSFYELGDRLLLENGNLNKNISIEKIREYIYFSETKEKCEQKGSDFLGECNGVAYYFIYKKDDITTLDFEYLAKLKKASSYVIYADVCVLSDETMMKYNITFKKIPRDIKKV